MCYGMANLIVQARPEAVVDVAAPALLHHQSAKAVFQSLDAVVYGYLALHGTAIVGAALPLPLAACSLLLMFFDLRIETGHDALEASQAVQQLGIWRFPALAGRTTGPREHAFDLCTYAIGARVLLVALHFPATTRYARPGVRPWSAHGRGPAVATTGTAIRLWCVFAWTRRKQRVFSHGA